MKDERIEQAINKIRSEMAVIIFYGVAVSFLVKTLVFNMSLEDKITEFLILIFFPIYQFIRMHMMKISIYSGPGNKQPVKNLVIAIAIFLVMSAMLIFKSMKQSEGYVWQNSIPSLLTFLVLFVSVFFISNKFNQHRGHQYENEFDDDK